MVERVLALHRAELATSTQLRDQLDEDGQLASAPVITALDPVLHTYAVLNGFAQVQLAGTPSLDIGTRLVPRGWAATRGFFAALDTVLADLVPEATASAWCGHWVQHLHLVCMGYQQLGAAMARRWQGDQVHVLLPDQTYAFGFHSFVPGLVLSNALREGGVAVKLYGSSLPPADATQLPDLLAATGPDPQLLCHLPTCFQDAALFSREIAASGRSALVLPAQFYDVPTGDLPRCPLAPPAVLAAQLPAAVLLRIDACMQRVTALLVAQLTPLLPGTSYLHRQVAALVDALRNNALVFFTLVQRFDRQRPATVLMSNHDTGIHGALFSFAQRVQARLLLVPHAKIFNVPIKSRGQQVLCLTHPLQGGDVVDLYGQRMPTAALDFGEACHFRPAPPQPLATLGIVLNSLSDMGLMLSDLDAYLAGLRALRQWCADHQVACHIRCRPNGNALVLLCSALRMQPEELLVHQEGDIRAFGLGCDLVIGYDTPTSGAFALLEEGVPVLQALCRPLGHEEWCIVDPDVVPQLTLAEVTQRLAAFQSDGLALWTFRQQQLGRFTAARTAARPLRSWL